MSLPVKFSNRRRPSYREIRNQLNNQALITFHDTAAIRGAYNVGDAVPFDANLRWLLMKGWVHATP